MVAKKGKRSTKKVGSLKAKSMSASKARGVRGGAQTIKPGTVQTKWEVFTATLEKN